MKPTSHKEGDNIVVNPFDDDHGFRITVLPSGRIVWNNRTGWDASPEQAKQFAAGLIEAAEIAEGMTS